MPTEKGWVKLHRNIMDHWVYQDPLLLKIWITFLCMANHEDKKILLDGELIVIHRGQFWTSIRKLSMRTGLNHKTVERKVKLLAEDGMIFVDARQGRGTLITISKYADYQGFSEDVWDTRGYTAGDTKGYTTGTLRGTLMGHKQELKNDKALLKNEEEIGASPSGPADGDYSDGFEEV